MVQWLLDLARFFFVRLWTWTGTASHLCVNPLWSCRHCMVLEAIRRQTVLAPPTPPILFLLSFRPRGLSIPSAVFPWHWHITICLAVYSFGQTGHAEGVGCIEPARDKRKQNVDPRPPQKRFSVGCSSPFMQLAQHAHGAPRLVHARPV